MKAPRPLRLLTRALGIPLLCAVLLLGMILAGESGLLPPLDVLLTKAPTSWADPDVSDELVAEIAEPVEAAVAPPPLPEPLRINTAPADDSPTPPAAADPGLGLDQGAEKPDVELVTLETLMKHGRELIADGVDAPVLRASWRLIDIDTLVASGRGIVIAEWAEDQLRVVPGSHGLAAATDYRVFTNAHRRSISNRSIDLGKHRGLTSLMARLRRHVGLMASEPLRLSFWLSSSLDHGLRSKQLGAAAHAGFDLARHKYVATEGDLRATPYGVLYVIRSLHVDGRTYPFRDPDARHLVRSGT